MTGKAENKSSWSDFFEDSLLRGNVDLFSDEEIAEWSEWAELRDSARLLEYLLSEPQTVH